MTLETKEIPPTDSIGRIRWHTQRMWKFYEAARRSALAADDLRRQWQRSVGGRGDTNSLAEANTNCDNDRVWKTYVAEQQMYDRWTMREAEVVQTLTALMSFHREMSSMPPPNAMLGDYGD